MGIFDRVLDAEKTHSFKIDDTEYVVRLADVAEARKYIDEHADPELKDKAMDDDRTHWLNKYFADRIIVSISDSDLHDTPENRMMIMSNPAFTNDATQIRDESYKDSHFRMGRDEALKKFSVTTSQPSAIGSASIATA